MEYKIVADSSADLVELSGIPFASAPLIIRTAEREFTDNAALDVAEMQNYLADYRGKSASACPNIGEYLAAFDEAENVLCVTITGKLSGSYNAACSAAKEYTAAHPDRHVLVVDSISTGPESALLIERLRALAAEKLPIAKIRETITEYQKKLHLFFALESMQNLANNGRVNPIVAKVAGVLGIRAVGKASDEGTLEMVSKPRGAKKMIEEIVEQLKRHGYAGERLKIHHAQNLSAASDLLAAIRSKFPSAKAEIGEARGLCSFYAERGGLLIGFEGAINPAKAERVLLV